MVSWCHGVMVSWCHGVRPKILAINLNGINQAKEPVRLANQSRLDARFAKINGPFTSATATLFRLPSLSSLATKDSDSVGDNHPCLGIWYFRGGLFG